MDSAPLDTSSPVTGSTTCSRRASARFDTNFPVAGSSTFSRLDRVDLGIGPGVLEPGACEGRPATIGPLPVLAGTGMTVACVDELANNEAEGAG
ncbi:hypothetical protein BCR61_12730 [Xanthomonas oryzae pv. oryzae]|nr:hypothetical protein BCR61_12730 [Xanthomonas oryzae pv. oryzae]